MNYYNFTCSACKTVNRIPADKQGRSGHCGQCHAPLPPLYYQPQQLNSHSYDQFISRYPGPVLAEFWAPW